MSRTNYHILPPTIGPWALNEKPEGNCWVFTESRQSFITATNKIYNLQFTDIVSGCSHVPETSFCCRCVWPWSICVEKLNTFDDAVWVGCLRVIPPCTATGHAIDEWGEHTCDVHTWFCKCLCLPHDLSRRMIPSLQPYFCFYYCCVNQGTFACSGSITSAAYTVPNLYQSQKWL